MPQNTPLEFKPRTAGMGTILRGVGMTNVFVGGVACKIRRPGLV